MQKQTRITKKKLATVKPESSSPFEKYRGIGRGSAGSGRKEVLRAIRQLRGRRDAGQCYLMLTNDTTS